MQPSDLHSLVQAAFNRADVLLGCAVSEIDPSIGAPHRRVNGVVADRVGARY